MSVLSRVATALAVGVALVATSATVAEAAPAPASPCPSGWQFQVLAKTPHQNVYFQRSAKGPAVLVMSVTRRITDSTTLPDTIPPAARAVIFAALDAQVSPRIRPSVTTAGQHGVRYTVPKGQTWFAADILKHWTVVGRLVRRQRDCFVLKQTLLTLKAYQPFAWAHRTGRAFRDF